MNWRRVIPPSLYLFEEYRGGGGVPPSSLRGSADGKGFLARVQTVNNGVPFGRPYQSPFSVR